MRKPRLQKIKKICIKQLPDLDVSSSTAKETVMEQPSTSRRFVEFQQSLQSKNTNVNDSAVESVDLGSFLEKPGISDCKKYELLTNPSVNCYSHDFKKDVSIIGKDTRKFKESWLYAYPWLVYSTSLKGGLCKYCVLFKPALKRGIFGSFVIKAHKDFKHFHEDARNHAKSKWHHEAVIDANNFCDSMTMKKKDIKEQLDSAISDLIQINRSKLTSILKAIIFCGTHDIALRGNHSNGGNFQDLLRFRIEAGDQVLKDHITTYSGKAKYTSHRVQNELINICGTILQDTIVKEVNDSQAFSLLADETADISGKEQMSIGVRYIKTDSNVGWVIKEEFMGFAELEKLDAGSIADAILHFTDKIGLDMTKLIGLGFDGCSTMAGKDTGVQRRIREKYPKAVYFHCASHRLNLVVNDLNIVPEIRNTIGTIKKVIRFFRESTLRRKKIPKIPILCETRWSEKYRCIRNFSNNFSAIKEALSQLSTDNEANQETRSQAFQLDIATSSVVFIVCLKIISRYSSYLEPVVNKMQSVDFDLHAVHMHVKEKLLWVFQKHRVEAVMEFEGIFTELQETCDLLEIEIKTSRTTARQTHRSNISMTNPIDYYRLAVFIPYLDSLIVSLESRFNDHNKTPSKGILIHPNILKNTEKDTFVNAMKDLSKFYDNENLEVEARTWYDVWKNKDCGEEVKLIDLFSETTFFPSIMRALVNYLTIPPTTCTVERSFSTLRRIKTWLRSTMSEERLSSLSLLSIHRCRVQELNLEELAIDKFSKQKRNLQFAFSEKL